MNQIQKSKKLYTNSTVKKINIQIGDDDPAIFLNLALIFNLLYLPNIRFMQKSIKQEVNYLEVLQIDKKDGLDFSKIKNSFRSHMIKNSMKRLKRVQLNLAYEIALEKINKTQTP